MRITETLNLSCTTCKAKLKFESILNMAITQIKTPICVECFDKLENIKQLENTLKDIKKVLKRS